MKHQLSTAFAMAAVVAALAAGAQSPVPSPSPSSSATPGSPAIVPGSLSGAPPSTASPAAIGPASPGASAVPTPAPAPAPSVLSPSRFHLHRPGTEVDGDLLTGNLASDVYILHGNVVLRSDPKVDRAFGSSTESDDPITVNADEIDVDRAGLSYVAKGNVHFVQGSRSGRSDTAVLNEQTHDLDLLGHADVMDGDHRARADKMHYNTLDRRFHGLGDVRIYEPAPTPNPKASSTAPPKRRRRLPL